jgi:hypothetical protein
MFHMVQQGKNIFPYPSKYSIQPTQLHVHSPDIAPARLDVTHIDWQTLILYLLGTSYLYTIFKRTIHECQSYCTKDNILNVSLLNALRHTQSTSQLPPHNCDSSIDLQLNRVSFWNKAMSQVIWQRDNRWQDELNRHGSYMTLHHTPYHGLSHVKYITLNTVSNHIKIWTPWKCKSTTPQAASPAYVVGVTQWLLVEL